MNYSATTYQIDTSTVNKVFITDGWIMIYNETDKTILTQPTKMTNSFMESINTICIKPTKEGLVDVAITLNLANLLIDDK